MSDDEIGSAVDGFFFVQGLRLRAQLAPHAGGEHVRSEPDRSGPAERGRPPDCSRKACGRRASSRRGSRWITALSFLTPLCQGAAPGAASRSGDSRIPVAGVSRRRRAARRNAPRHRGRGDERARSSSRSADLHWRRRADAGLVRFDDSFRVVLRQPRASAPTKHPRARHRRHDPARGDSTRRKHWLHGWRFARNAPLVGFPCGFRPHRAHARAAQALSASSRRIAWLDVALLAARRCFPHAEAGHARRVDGAFRHPELTRGTMRWPTRSRPRSSSRSCWPRLHARVSTRSAPSGSSKRTIAGSCRACAAEILDLHQFGASCASYDRGCQRPTRSVQP